MNTADILRQSCIIGSEARSPKPNMPAKDLYHDTVKQGLIKEGWKFNLR
ncbi:element excision factor XisH family protein [Microcoleus sp. CAWBG640]